MTSTDPVLNLHQVAERLGLDDPANPRRGYDRVRRHIQAGDLRAVKRGRHYYVRASWVEEFLDDDRAESA